MRYTVRAVVQHRVIFEVEAQDIHHAGASAVNMLGGIWKSTAEVLVQSDEIESIPSIHVTNAEKTESYLGSPEDCIDKIRQRPNVTR